jgi:hypothetical protein
MIINMVYFVMQKQNLLLAKYIYYQGVDLPRPFLGLGKFTPF